MRPRSVVVTRVHQGGALLDLVYIGSNSSGSTRNAIGGKPELDIDFTAALFIPDCLYFL